MGPPAAQVKRVLRGYLNQLEALAPRRGRGAPTGHFVDHLVKLFHSYWPGLFHTYGPRRFGEIAPRVVEAARLVSARMGATLATQSTTGWSAPRNGRRRVATLPS